MRKTAEMQGRVEKLIKDKAPFYKFLARSGNQLILVLAKSGLPVREGMRVHFFYVPGNPGRVVEWVPDVSREPSGEEIYGYLLSGRVPGIGREEADRLYAEYGGRLMDALQGGQREAYLRSRAADPLYLKLKHACPGLTWNSFYAMYRICGYKPEKLHRELHSGLYRAAWRAGVPFAEADSLALSLGYSRTGPLRMEGFLLSLFCGDKSSALCCPKDVLVKIAEEKLGISGDAAGAALDGLVPEQAAEAVVDHVRCIYYPASSYRCEQSVCKDLCRIASGRIKDTGVAKSLKALLPVEGNAFAEQVVRAVSANPVVLIIPGGEEGIPALLADYFSLKGIPFAAYKGGEGNPREDAPGAYMVEEADRAGIAWYMGFLAGLPKGARLILCGEYRAGMAPGVHGRVFADMAESGMFPVLTPEGDFKGALGDGMARSGLCFRLREKMADTEK